MSNAHDVYVFAFNSPDMKIKLDLTPQNYPEFIRITYLSNVSVSITGPPAPH